MRPVLLDVGAAGKGLLVDIVTELLVVAGHTDLIVDEHGRIVTNWPGYMEKVGNIAGPLLAYEVLTAFFLEAGFLGVGGGNGSVK